MIKWNEYTWYSKLLALIFFVFVLPPLAFYVGTQYQKTEQAIELARSFGSATTPADYKNLSYTIDNHTVTLVNGLATTPSAPGSASQLVTRYFGDEATGDLNNDGNADVAFIVSQSGGGSGTFYYVVAALSEPAGYRGTNAIFLGDRIAPQTVEIQNGEIVVNYADRPQDAPMTAVPSIAVSKYIKVSNNQLVVEQ